MQLVFTIARTFRTPVQVVLERRDGLLLLNGEPLELARVETRVVRTVRFWRKAWVVSVWALAVEGHTLEVELGRCATLVDASGLSGRAEAFLVEASKGLKKRA